ncbi:hypothetical protein ASPVEDRAFT_24871 [Aspergillus versicolor CBS 583.65]|uniref:AAA+ ATPase domain-containing protein n=1 Tax=Aspergillus versicolor CBS 583.65 TaxID=1036611 RepID=A0A1L9P8Y3_ASPVE|nr:uncharacterized protein ASPVEDRAFT_24871 [Aspergillus versicolor CBS 583.65]OJI97958.1 hypothetical protein ASPVEDRAFT_24871 [Aspergillus versicolor CBS 583.65]
MSTQPPGAEDLLSPSLTDIIEFLKPGEEPDKNAPARAPANQVNGKDTQPAEGSECAIQTLYEGPPKCRCCKNWVEQYPDDLRMAIEQQPRTKQRALIVRMGINHGDGKPLALHSVVIQSQSLKDTLGEVFEGYKGITPSLKKVVFKAPFRPFFYRWSRFCQILERQKKEDPTAATYTQLLFDVLKAELAETMAEVDDLLQHRVVTYRMLWALFEPGVCVVTSASGSERFFLVEDCEYNDEKGYLGVVVRFVDWDGKRFGYDTGCLAICGFAGTKAITDLDVFPVAFHPSREQAEAAAISRGRRFRELCGLQYMAYSGLITYKVGDTTIEKNTDGRIVIDASSFFHAMPGRQIHLEPLGSIPASPHIEVGDDHHTPEDPGHLLLRMHRDNRSVLSNRKMIGNIASKENNDVAEEELLEKHFLLCTTYVRGFSLKLKIWAEFALEGIRTINWNDSAYPQLMLPAGYRDLVLAFVEGQANNKDVFDDVIEGKGLGVIMLFVGSPGTGKTLTAESIADKVRKPLYVLSSGELGQDAGVVEQRLQDALKLAEKWDAVLLFDECDVFLQERSSHHLGHNEIVAVFLRLLEYYRGTLIMTTNRADSIDKAFQSRIHLTLHYPELEASSMNQIWRRFLGRSNSDIKLTDEQYERLSRLSLNGRQIKNTVKIATLLACQQKQPLGMDQIRTVLEASREIDAGGLV